MNVMWALGGLVAGFGAGLALRGTVRRFTPAGLVLPVLSAVVVALLCLRFAGSVEVLAFACLGGLGVALAIIDTATMRLPDVLTLPAYPLVIVLLGVAVVFGSPPAALGRALLGGLVLGAAYLVLGLLRPNDFGFGDVKLSGVLGVVLAWLGWPVLVFGAALGFVLSSVMSLGLLAARRITLKSSLPFGPFMLAGALLAVLFMP